MFWDAIISESAMSGYDEISFGHFDPEEKYTVKAVGVTFIGLLCGCFHAGLVDKG